MKVRFLDSYTLHRVPLPPLGELTERNGRQVHNSAICRNWVESERLAPKVVKVVPDKKAHARALKEMDAARRAFDELYPDSFVEEQQ